ncbi:KpsF/GutQ family sugar-phosphate isomerase [Agarivorans albus]
MSYLESAKSVIKNEIEGILEVESKLDQNFESLVEHIATSKGRVVMCGMGKSGHIAKKIFATLVSTGTPSMFMHPAEAFHGDLGMVQPEDIFFAISNSGETSEVTQLLPFIKGNNNSLIAMTGNPNSTLATLSDHHIDIGVSNEACPLNLAPTTSTTVSLVIGDAISVALMEAKGFKAEHFARYHPGGSLGRKLLQIVGDVCHDPVYVDADASLMDVLKIMSTRLTGLVLVGDELNLYGVITDGDIRTCLRNAKSIDIDTVKASSIMTVKPIKISFNTKCGDADLHMAKDGINSLIVINSSNQVVGIYDNINRKNQ